MNRITRYPIVTGLQQVCQLAGLDVARVLRRAALPKDFCDTPSNTVSAHRYFAIWDAVMEEADQPDLPLRLGLVYAHGPFVSPIFAFSSSSNVVTGFERLVDFKPLLGPMALDVVRQEDAVSLRFRSVAPGLPIPASLSLFELAYIIEMVRTCTGAEVVPLVAACAHPDLASPELTEHLGVVVSSAPTPTIVFSRADVERPLITQNDMLWRSLEPALRQELEQLTRDNTMHARVRRVLMDHMAGGVTTTDAVAQRLYVSKRSLQRRLSEEGISFKDILRDTRTELARHYLSQPEMSLAEISYLLGFGDPASFFRAFHDWTGSTPAQVRRELIRRPRIARDPEPGSGRLEL